MPADPLVLRPAREEDLGALGRIMAERYGGDAAEHAGALRRFLATGASDGQSLLLTAEWGGEVVAFGKCRYVERSPGAPPNAGPEGWYLAGVVVDERFRRRGIGRALTRARLTWIAGRAGHAYYFANARNAASIALHAEFGFRELTRDFALPGAEFEGGEGILFVAGRGGPGRSRQLGSAPRRATRGRSRIAGPSPSSRVHDERGGGRRARAAGFPPAPMPHAADSTSPAGPVSPRPSWAEPLEDRHEHAVRSCHDPHRADTRRLGRGP